MNRFQSVDEALQAINDDAATLAWQYLEAEVPNTAAAIQYLIVKADWDRGQVLGYINNKYGVSKEKTRKNVELIVDALIEERDNV